MTLEQVAIPAGTDTGNLSRIERGKQSPTERQMRNIANSLGVSVEELMSEPADTLESSARISDSITGHVVVREMFPGRVPLLPWSRLGNWDGLAGAARDNFEWVPCTRKFAWGKAAAGVLEGDAMLQRASEPSFPAGTILVFAAATDAKPGDLVLAVSGTAIMFKRLAEDAGERYLQSLNDAYPIRPMGDAVIAGLLVEGLRRITP